MLTVLPPTPPPAPGQLSTTQRSPCASRSYGERREPRRTDCLPQHGGPICRGAHSHLAPQGWQGNLGLKPWECMMEKWGGLTTTSPGVLADRAHTCSDQVATPTSSSAHLQMESGRCTLTRGVGDSILKGGILLFAFAQAGN